MISEIIKNLDMSNNYESGWLPIQIEAIGSIEGPMEAVSIQIYWDAVIGVLNGTIDIYQTNDLNSRNLLTSYNVNSISNKTNSILLEIAPIACFMKVVYTKNGIVGGRLNAVMRFRENL